MVQLEGSGKWPSELPAISSVKTAFYSYLSGSLADQCQLLCSPTHQHLDVLKVCVMLVHKAGGKEKEPLLLGCKYSLMNQLLSFIKLWEFLVLFSAVLIALSVPYL